MGRGVALIIYPWPKTPPKSKDPESGFVAVGNLFDEDRGTHPKGRYPKMMRAGKQTQLGVTKLKAALLEVAMDDMNVQAVVFEPARLTIHGSTRSRPAASGPFWRIDLKSIPGFISKGALTETLHGKE